MKRLFIVFFAFQVITLGTFSASRNSSDSGLSTDFNLTEKPGDEFVLEPDLSQSEVRSLIELFSADMTTMSRFYTFPFSYARMEKSREIIAAYQSSLAKLNFNSLSRTGKADYILFQHHLRSQLKRLEIQRKQYKEVEALLPVAQAIAQLDEKRKREGEVEAKACAVLLNGWQKQLEELRQTIESRLKKSEPANLNVPLSAAMRAARAGEEARTALQSWFNFFNGYDPLFTWWVAEPYRSLDATLESYIRFLREQVAGVRDIPGEIPGEPVGREALLADLEAHMISYTPEELIEIGWKEMAWCEKEMIRAATDLGFGKDWKKALEYVKTRHMEPGKQPALIRDLTIEAIEFLERHSLITIPQLAKDMWRLEMMTPQQQLINPFFSGGEAIRISFPTNTMSYEARLMSMRGNNQHFARATVHHELIPGHNLQFFMNARYKSYRRLFSTSFWGEGWPLHWEMLLYDLNFPRSPEDRIGMLFWRMHRCARIVFSLSFHLGKMSAKEAVEFLVSRVGHERANAEGEVRRSFAGTFEPLYQCAYLIGGLQMRALYRELVTSGKMTPREFHDRVMRENSIPIVVLRLILTGEQINSDFRPNWRFY